MPQFDLSTFASSIFWFLLCFGICVTYFVRIILPRYNVIIDKRLYKIRYDLEQAQQLNEQADSLLALCEKMVLDTKQEVAASFHIVQEELNAKIILQTETLQEEMKVKHKVMEESFLSQQKTLNEAMKSEIERAAQQVCALFSVTAVQDGEGKSYAHVLKTVETLTQAEERKNA